MEPITKTKSLPYLLDILEHEMNNIRAVLQLWEDKIPPPVLRSITARVRKQGQVIQNCFA
jgi:hypothetical protein